MDWEMRAASLILFSGILLATIQNGIAERRIVCYYTNWSVYRPGTAKFSPQNINPYLCTHLIYAFGGFTKDNALRPFDKYQDIEKGGYAKFTGLKTYNKNLKTMLAIGGWNEGSSRFSPMVADAARRREFVKNSVKFLRQNHFDGLDLDWEYPAFRDGGKPRDKDNYANLVQELREEFERESSKTGRPRLLLSMAMPAGIEYIDKGYDVPRLNDYLDFVNLLSYDYHSAYEPAVNHHSPLYPLEEDNEYNYDAELTIDYTISHLLEKGASADKIVLGIPTYGRSYTLFNQDATELGSPADGPGVEGEATREKGYLAYYEICESIAESDEWEIVQANSNAMGPYAFKGDQWVGYDDEDIVKLKARYVNEKKLGGIMFWSIDNDDFRGKCHGRPYPLIEAAKEALLTETSRNTIDKTKSVDSRKKTRTQGTQNNSVARKLGTNGRRGSTTPAPATKKRVSSSRPKYRTVTRSRTSDEEHEDREVSRRSYEPSADEDAEARNTVRVTEKTERPRSRSRSKTRSGSTDQVSRRKQSRRRGQTKTDEGGESLSNRLTTPEPPTTPDPGTDFKCEDEGFFPHPRDCKKYFWCLDSGPGGLGVVAHQFTCPSGLVFNKGADSCDYPRNVICPKSKTSVASTTRSPITAATSRTTYLYSTTTAKAEVSQDEYDSEEDYDEDENEESEEEEVREEPKITTTAKPLVYKTLTRNRPTTTATATTTTSRPTEPERIINGEDEEDPRVIKELIDLIKKAGGIEQLERQLLLQERNSDTTSGSESVVTPATISRSLYERVLNRQTNKINNQRPVFSSSETSYVNGPGRAQFEGLDDIPEVKSLRRSQKPQYVTIERPKSVAKEPANEDIDENEEDDDNTEIAFSEEQSVANPLEAKSSTQRVTPNYVNIRRTRPSATTSRKENDVEGKETETEEDKPIRRRRPSLSSKQQDNETSRPQNRGSAFRNSERGDDLESTEKDDSSTTAKSRYVSIQRFRSTTSKNSPSAAPASELTGETTSSPRAEEYPEVASTTASTTAVPSTTATPITSTSTEIITVISVEPSENMSGATVGVTTGPTAEPVKLVEDSATEILLTTVPASSTSQSTTTAASRTTVATVSLPRPFGFTRRRSGLLEATTTTTTTTTSNPSSNNQTRSKVADSKAIRLPTLKELIGYPTTYDRITTMPSVLLHLLRFDVDNDISQENVEESVGGTSESYPPVDFASDAEKTSARSLEETTEEIGDTWLRQASESKAKSRAAKSKDISVGDQEVSVTNAIQGDEDKRKESPTSIYLKPTTMRGIPLANLTPSPVMRGFYVTKSDYDLLTPTSADVFASSETTVEQQTETTLNPDVSTTDEIVTVARNYQNVSKPDAANNDTNVLINDQDTDISEEKFSTLSTLAISTEDSDNLENLSDYMEPDIVRSPASKFASKRGKSLRDDVYRSTTPSNTYVLRSTTAARHAIALAVNRYNELTTSLWTGKRIVARKRNRTTVSPIKDAIRLKAESGFTHAAVSTSGDSSGAVPTMASSMLTSAMRKLPATPTISSTPTLASKSTISPEILNVDDNLATSIAATSEDWKNHVTTEATMGTLTDSIAAATHSIATIASAIDDRATITTISNIDAITITTFVNTDFPATITTSTAAVANAPAIVNYTVFANIVPTPRAIEADFANTTTAAAASTEVESIYTTADYSVVAATSNTHTTESVITITPAAIASTGVEITPTIANYSAVTIPTIGDTREVVIEPAVTATFETANTEVGNTSSIANYSSIATTDSTREVAIEAAKTTARETTSTEPETTFTTGNYSENLSTFPTTGNAGEVTVEPAITIRLETTDTEVEAAFTTVNYPTLNISTFMNATETIPVAATVASTTYSSTTASVDPSTADARVNATVSETTSNLADTVTTSIATTTTSAIVISPTSTDPNVIATPANVDIPHAVTSAVTETSAITTAFKITSTIPPRILVTNTDTTLMTTSAPSTTKSVATPNILGINDDSEVLPDVAITQPARSIEIPTFETSHISLTSITSAIPSSFPSSGSATPTIETIASSTRADETTVISKNTQTPTAPLSIAIPITDTATVALETSTIPSTMYAIFRGSIATNSILRTTTNVDEPTSASTTSETGSTVPELKTDAKEATSRATQTRARDRTSSRHDATNRQFGRRTSGRVAVHRRVVNRTDDWIERPSTRRPTGQYPRRRVTVYRGRPHRPPGYTSSSRVVEENRRRRIMQKRLRAETVNSTARSDEKTDEVQNVTEGYDRAPSAGRGTKVISKKIREKIGEEKKTVAFLAENTTLSVQSSNSTEDELPRVHREDRKMGGRRKIVLKRTKFQSNETFAIEEIDPSSERLPDSAQNNARMGETPSKGEKARRRMRVILKSVKSKSEERNSTAEEADTNLNSTDRNLQSNLRIDKKFSDERNRRRRMRVVLKSIKPKAEERNSTIEETGANADSNDENLQGSSSSYLRVGNLLNKENRRRRMRVVLKSIRPKYKEENSTTKEADPGSIDKILQSSFPSSFRMAKNFSDEKNTGRRMKVVLKSVRRKPEKEDFVAEETGTDTESKTEDLQGDFSSKLYANDNLPDEDTMERRMTVVLKEISPKSKGRETTIEETSESPASVDDSLRGDLSSNLHADDDLFGENRTMASKSEEGQATTEQPIEHGAGLHATETSVRVEENTDRPSNEVNLSVRGSGESINRRLGIGHSDRQRKPTTQLTTASPLINTLSGTHSTHRKSRPVAATLSPRMDLIDAFEGTESYSKLTGVEDDQRTDLSDQSIRAQEFAVTLADPPSLSSDIGRTPLLEDAVRRKISTTVAPKTDPITTSRTVSRYGTDFRSRQRSRAKDKPTVNATVRPRRPPIVDYDYYEDEMPIVVGKSVLNSKLFLTSRGTIRCLDQGNFPHPYSCKKFITCARMVNGQVIGTEYTCPAKLSFDPVGGICNWSAGLGCKD